MATRTLPKVGFPTSDAYAAGLDSWTRLVLGASIAAPDGKGLIQDNRALPEILQGLEQLFGAGSAAALIVQAVLLHQSLNVVPEWPNPGSLTDGRSPAMHRTDADSAAGSHDAGGQRRLAAASIRRARQNSASSTLAVFANVRRLVSS